MIVYTALVGDEYSRKIQPPSNVTCFTGATPPLFTRPVMEAKRYKCLPHMFLPDYDITIWHDANIRLKRGPEYYVERYLRMRSGALADMAVFEHPVRETVWQEFEALRTDGRMRDPYLQEQLRQQHLAYRDAGLPANAQLYECNFIIRRNVDRVNRLMEAWWAQICRWQWRDQVSLPWVLETVGGVVVNPIFDDGDIRQHPDFEYLQHY